MVTSCWEWLVAEIGWLGWLVQPQHQPANSGLPTRLIKGDRGAHIRRLWLQRHPRAERRGSQRKLPAY